MKIKTFFAFSLVFAILLSVSASAYDTIPGLDANSEEYQRYTSCVDSCAQCEASCKNGILRNLAETKSDEAFCQQLPSEQQANCLDNVYSRKAIEQKDASLCGKISNEEEKQSCSLSAALSKAIASESAAECDALGDQASACKSSFYFSMAMNKIDAGYCDKLDENSKDICIARVEEQKRMQAPSPETPAGEEVSQTPEGEAQGASEGKGSLTSIVIYAGIGIAVFALIFITIIIIRKKGGKKPEETPLVFQKPVEPAQQAQATQPAAAQGGAK